MNPAQQCFARKSIVSGVLGAVAAFGLLMMSPGAARAQDDTAPQSLYSSAGEQEHKVEGLWLTTRFPEMAVQAGEEAMLDLNLVNNGLPPQRVELGLEGLPEGWKWQMLGGGKEVAAAIAPQGEPVSLSLKLTPPKDAEKKAYQFTVTGKAEGKTLELPITLTLAESEPARLTLEPELPALRGTVESSFDFQVTMKNEGQKDAVVNLLSKAPNGFEVTFKEQYGSQELTSLPLKAGESKDLSVSVSPPDNIAAGQYPVIFAATGDDISAKTQLVLDITGRPTLALTGPGGRLSGDATAGEPHTFTFTVANSGTAPAKNVKFSSNPPSNWKVEFEPKEIAELAVGKKSEVAVTMTPSEKAIAGDYVVGVSASGEGASDDASFRVTVRTSTLWGVAGLGVIAAAVVVMGFAVSRYGRR